jgi:predicted RNase H-like HicB family nuclease
MIMVEEHRVKTAYQIVVTAELIPDEEEGGYSVYCPELDIYTQGETVEEAIANLQEAAEGYIEVVGLDKSANSK